MNSKRRAELQRKLTLNAVPRPPVGLAERIKADIPQYLERETVPQRVTRSLTFHMRIAASVIVLAGAVIVAMMVQQNRRELASTAATRPVIFAPQPRSMAPADTTTTVAAVARTEEVQLDIVQETPIAVPAQIADARVAPPARRSQPGSFAQEFMRDTDDERGVESEASSGEDSMVVTAEAPVIAEPRHMTEVAPSPETPAVTPAQERVAAAPTPAPSVAKTADAFAQAARLDRRQETTAGRIMAAEARERDSKQQSVFGISVSQQAFDEIRMTLESGRRPAASAVNVEALVNYFAGAPARRPREVTLDVEASPAVMPAEGDHAVLRFTVDTPAGNGIVATAARIDVVLNDAVVARARRVGDAEPLARESVLPYGTSVTGLYALEMKPGLRSSQLVATVRLHYTINGKPATITELVHGHDLARTWQHSTRRHRLASLGALWAESLKGAETAPDVARRAEELATQNPDDVRARELARAASASAAGGR